MSESGTVGASETQAEPRQRDYVEEVRALARAYGIEEIPDVEPVEEVTPFEAAHVIADCLTEMGFPTNVNDDATGWEGSLLREQEQEHKEATIVCLLRYPAMPKYLMPETDEQLQTRYEWTRDEVIPCLQELGYAPEPMPSLEAYVESARSGHEGLWSPFTAFPRDALDQILADYHQTCPSEDPPLDRLWPDG